MALIQHVLWRSFHTVLHFFFAVVALVCIRIIYKRINGSSISRVPGPAKSDWFFGNMTDFSFNEVGVAHFGWQKQFGTAIKFHGVLEDEYLLISDPKALRYIYSEGDTVFIRQRQNRSFLHLIVGSGLLIVFGDQHKRQRQILQPAFGIKQIKGMSPLFERHSQRLVSAIRRKIADKGEGQICKINVHDYMARVALDFIFDAAFDYQLGSLDKISDPLRDAFHAMENYSLFNSSRLTVFIQWTLDYLPLMAVKILGYLPIEKFIRVRNAQDILEDMSKTLVTEKIAAHKRGEEGGKDLLSLVIKANAQEVASSKLSDREVNGQIASFAFAGHSTTSNILSFSLLELAKNYELQARIRQEIKDTRRRLLEQGQPEIEMDDYERMPMLTAFIKEVLRFHPVASNGNRTALQDTAIPLTHPIKLASGEIMTEISVSKGQNIYLNLPGFNRLPEYFGADSYEFNIDRWLNGAKDIRPHGLGMYAGLATFGHGNHGCIGWRLSIYETEVMITELLSNFEFRLIEDGKAIERLPGQFMTPGIKGERSAGMRLPLGVSALTD